MRPRRLEVTAFGPFPATEVVDFGELERAGLFLIHGKTGAGKSSLLDALCFALYGAVPGTRAAVDRLRSDHARSHVEPRVALEFDIGGTGWRIERTPVWDRPKRATPVPATAVLARAVPGGGWEPVAEKKTDVDAIVRDLLGLDVAQFQRVILLPQGQFQQVLQARDDDRERLLRTLFGTERFHRFTDDLFTEARELERRVEELAADEARAGERMVEAWQALGPQPAPALDDLAAALAPVVAAAALAAERAESQWRTATEALRAATERADRWRRRDEATVELVRLAAGGPEVQAQRDRAAAAARAEPVRGLEATAAQAVEQLASARGARHAAATRLPLVAGGLALPGAAWAAFVELAAAITPGRPEGSSPAPASAPPGRRPPRPAPATVRADAVGAAEGGDAGPADRAGAARVHEGLVGLAARVADLVDAAAAATAHERRALAAHRDAATARQEAEAAAAVEATAGERLGVLDGELAAARVAAAGLDAVAAQAERTAAAAAAAAEVPDLEQRALALGEAATAAHQRAVSAAEVVLALVERRVAGLSAELAAALVDGEPCPVCGSAAHPAPHRGPAAVVEAAEIDAARHDAAGSARRAEQASVAAAEAQVRLATRRAEAGDLATAPAAAADAAARHAAMAAEAGRVPVLEAGRVAVLEAAGVARQVATEARERAVRLDAAAAAETESAGARRAEVAAVIGPDAAPGAVLAVLDEATTLLRAWLDAADREARLAEGAAEAAARLLRTAHEIGFADVAAAIGALATPAEREAWERAVAEHAMAVGHWQAVLAQPELADLGDEPPDVARLEEQEQALRARRDALRTAHERASAAAGAVATHDARRRHRREELQPRRTQAEQVRRLADLCRGNGPTRTSLERWVLAAFLDDICRQANVRLAVMTDGRFQLRHDSRRRRGNAPSGLTIAIADTHTGDERDVLSLSGGETFLASLALALGLADVVRQHAGGVRLDALFVDEGFGALDADALDLAMEQLDALRSGGRLVGIISHVPVLRERIGVGIEVTATPHGSSVRVGEIPAA